MSHVTASLAFSLHDLDPDPGVKKALDPDFGFLIRILTLESGFELLDPDSTALILQLVLYIEREK